MSDENRPNTPVDGHPSRRENENEDGTTAGEHILPSPRLAQNDGLAVLAETAKNYARAARATNTQRAYDSDWRQFSSWLRRSGLPQMPPDPQTVGLYLAACADGGVHAGARNIRGVSSGARNIGAGHGAEPTSVATL
jgi:hypothetical protein